jgi:predicted phage tail protein
MKCAILTLTTQKIYSMTNQSKNPIFWSAVAFLGGIIIAAWGWDKNESTIASRTTFSVPMMVIGVTMIVGGLIGFFKFGSKK